MRTRSAVTGRREIGEVIGGPLELKVAGPSMLGIGCPDRHPLQFINSPTPPTMHDARNPARAGSFVAPKRPSIRESGAQNLQRRPPERVWSVVIAGRQD